MPPSNAARAAPAIAERDPCEKARLAGARTLLSENLARTERTGSIVTEAAQEYRSSRQSRDRAKPEKGEQACGLSQAMRLDFVHELLDAIPREAVAAQLFIETGDIGLAHEHLTKLILNVKALVPTWNEVRTPAGERRAA